jgi:hypothetical protein
MTCGMLGAVHARSWLVPKSKNLHGAFAGAMSADREARMGKIEGRLKMRKQWCRGRVTCVQCSVVLAES